MPIISSSNKTHTFRWTWDHNTMCRPEDPKFPALQNLAHSEFNRIQDFHAYTSMQTQKTRSDLTKLEQLRGSPIAPSIRKTIGPDHSFQASMKAFTGETWPSLRHDFGVASSNTTNHAAEFRIDFETEKPLVFPSLIPLYKHFAKLGQDTDVLLDSLLDMKQVEDQIDDTKRNGHPKDRLGRKLKVDFEGNRLTLRNEVRYNFVYNFNKMSDEAGAYLHIRFEDQNPYVQNRSAFNQNLVFTFPTSNEERDIWRHVFWNEAYPEAGFPVETEYGKEITRIENSRRADAAGINQLAAEFNKVQIGGQIPPPSYRVTA